MSYIKITLSMADLRKLESGGTVTSPATQYCDEVQITLDLPKNTATGAEIKDFFDNGWDMDYYHESDMAKVQVQDEEGEWILQADKVYDLSELGELGWQGSHSNRTKPSSLTFEEAFLAWKGTK